MHLLNRILILFILAFSSTTLAAFTELGLSYNYSKRSFSELDNTENQSTTISVSIYIFERVALELSYTNGLFVKKEKENSLTTSKAQRLTTQYSDIYETNLIYVFADRKATFQPFVKGGMAYIKKKQVVQIDNDIPFEVNPKAGIAPSLGIGAKLMLSETFAIKTSYDTVRTPVDDNVVVDDIVGRVGVSWMF